MKTKFFFGLACLKYLLGIEQEVINRELSLELRGNYKTRDNNTTEVEPRAVGLQVITKGENIDITLILDIVYYY